jgi:hypothetical protein
LKLLRALKYEPTRDFHTSIRGASWIAGVPSRAKNRSLTEEICQNKLSIFHPLPGLPRVIFSDLVKWYETEGEKVNARPRKRENWDRPSVEFLLPKTDFGWHQYEMAFARCCVHHAVKIGLMNRERCCAQCGKTGTEAHHPDYNKPLLIIWLCPSHHRAYHRATKKQVDMASIKQPSRERSIHLVHLPSLHAYLDSIAK